jgi:hypothetical protein
LRIVVSTVYLSSPPGISVHTFFCVRRIPLEERFCSSRIPPVDCKTSAATTRDCRSQTVAAHNKLHTKKSTMAQDYIGASVSIFGIESPDLGCTCEHHAVCGSVVHLDMLVRFKKTLVLSGNSIF